MFHCISSISRLPAYYHVIITVALFWQVPGPVKIQRNGQKCSWSHNKTIFRRFDDIKKKPICSTTLFRNVEDEVR